jgi:P27 family predicted phage terminase small subunit
MGRRGPLPTPTNVLRKRGSWRARINRQEPRPEPGAPECPAWLTEGAKATWRRLARMLTAAGMITKADGQVLTRYCDAWDKWVKASQFLNERGEMYPVKDDKGNVRCFMPWPQVSQYHKLSQSLTRLEQELGLSPSGRARLSAVRPEPAPPPPADPEEEAKKAAFFDYRPPFQPIPVPKRREGA